MGVQNTIEPVAIVPEEVTVEKEPTTKPVKGRRGAKSAVSEEVKQSEATQEAVSSPIKSMKGRRGAKVAEEVKEAEIVEEVKEVEPEAVAQEVESVNEPVPKEKACLANNFHLPLTWTITKKGNKYTYTLGDLSLPSLKKAQDHQAKIESSQSQDNSSNEVPASPTKPAKGRKGASKVIEEVKESEP